MNCKKFQQQILLAQSGEQKRGDVPPLEAHLATCEACQAFRHELTQLTTTVQQVPLEQDVSEFTLERIRAAAQENLPERKLAPDRDRRIAPPPLSIWRPAFIYAAAAMVMLILGIHFIQQNQVGTVVELAPAEHLAWDPNIDDELNALDDYLVLALDAIDTGAQESTDDIATDLMNLEGWSI